MRRASYQHIDNIKIGGHDKPALLSVVRNSNNKKVTVCLPPSTPHLRIVTSQPVRERKPILSPKF